MERPRATSVLSQVHLNEQTSVGGAGRSLRCRYCSLIPGFGVKLSAIILAGPTVAKELWLDPQPVDPVIRDVPRLENQPERVRAGLQAPAWPQGLLLERQKGLHCRLT